MKKYFLPCLVVGSLFIATGCGKEEESKVMTCTKTESIQEGVDMSLNYKVTYKGDFVQLVETEETVTSDNKKFLELYQETVEGMYSPYKDVDGDKLISTTNINYEKIDTGKLIEIDSANKALIKDGKIKMGDIKAVYEQLGAECK